MKVTITGAAGFLGQKLARRILKEPVLTDENGVPQEITCLTLLDMVAPADDIASDARVSTLLGDLTDPMLLQTAISYDTDAIFHLAAVVSAGAEEDFDLGMSVNLDATRMMLEIARAHGNAPKFVFASSAAAFGGDMPDVIEDMTAPTPTTSYGTQKVIGELLVTDYSRKGYVDGRALRFPTVVVRPGKPNKAASTFASSIIREPLNGDPAICPVERDAAMWLSSPRTIVENTIRAHNAPGADWGPSRAVSLPGFRATVGDMVDSLQRVAGGGVVQRITWQPDPFIQRIVSGWPGSFQTDKAERLGMIRDENMETVIRAFIEDERGGGFVQ